MGHTFTLEQLLNELSQAGVRIGDIKKTAASIKKDHDLAMTLWASAVFKPRLLAVLILDKLLLTQEGIDQMAADLMKHAPDERHQIADWLLANQLMKSKKITNMLLAWQDHPSPMLRRLFWYHQARLRCTGQTPPGNSEALMASLETDIMDADPDAQWAMNYCAGQIGVHEPEYRAHCIQLGKSTGLYRDDIVARNCTPSYLPEFIRIEVGNRS